MSEVARTERGWPGHFICANRCMFRRNTLLECGERRVVVSTVGNMRPIEDSQGSMGSIGLERYWETMAFEAYYEKPYWEADISRDVPFESPWSLGKNANDLEANDMHERVVAELTRALQGETP